MFLVIIGGHSGQRCGHRHLEGRHSYGLPQHRPPARTQSNLQRSSCTLHLSYPQRLSASTCPFIHGLALATLSKVSVLELSFGSPNPRMSSFFKLHCPSSGAWLASLHMALNCLTFCPSSLAASFHTTNLYMSLVPKCKKWTAQNLEVFVKIVHRASCT